MPAGKTMCPCVVRSCASRCAEQWLKAGPKGDIIFLGAVMELACIKAMLDKTASHPNSPALKYRKNKNKKIIPYQKRCLWYSLVIRITKQGISLEINYSHQYVKQINVF